MHCLSVSTAAPAELLSPSLRDLALRGDLPSPSLVQALHQCLVQAGVASPNEPILSWDVLSRNLDRRDHRSRVAFRVSQGTKAICHLTLGYGLNDLWLRTQSFTKACPAITCQPLFFTTIEGLDCLAVEFFPGQSLETWVADGRMTPAAALAHAGTVFNALEATAEVSTSDAVHAELKSFFEQALTSPVFGEADGRFLRGFVFPFITTGALARPARSCWSNGDFVARNILVDAAGRVRLVDYEFAARTHFLEEAGWRWRSFSTLPPEARELPLRLDGESGFWLEAYFRIRQLLLVHENSIAHRAGLGTVPWLERLSVITAEAWGDFESSCFLRPLSASITAQLAELNEKVTALSRDVVERNQCVGLLDAELVRAKAELVRAKAELSTVRSEGEACRRNLQDQVAVRDEKIRRMQKSLSWIITAPLRACRRLLLD